MSWFSDNETLIQNALILALLAYSFQVAMSAGVFSLAGVGFYAVGAYMPAILITKHGWPTLTAVVSALLVSAVISLALALILARLRSLYLAMATMAFNLLVQLVAVEWEGQTGGALGLFGVPVVVSSLGLVLIVVAVSLLLWRRERGSSRRTLEALRLDERLAPVVGIDVVRRRHQAFVFSAILGALAGAMNTLIFSTINPTQVGFGLITTALTVIVVGGISSWVGALVGAFIITWLPDWLAFTGDWRPVVVGAITVLMVVWVNDGLVGLLSRGRRWAMARRRTVRAAPVAAEAGS
jgi:branched-chain amino acid transport system permease protein